MSDSQTGNSQTDGPQTDGPQTDEPPTGGLSEVVGRVVDGDGDGVPDAVVAIVAGSVPMPEIGLLCDGEGRFSLRLPQGEFTLRAHGPAGTGDVEVRSPPADGEIVIVTGGDGARR